MQGALRLLPDLAAPPGTWAAIQQHVRARWAPFLDQSERLGIAWVIGTEPHTEEQFQFIELAHAAEGPQVRIVCEVTSHMALSPLDALAHNATLAFGALALVGDSYILRAMFPLEDLSMTTLDRALR